MAPLLVGCTGEEEDLLQDPEALAGLGDWVLEERTRKTGSPAKPVLRCSLPEQETGQLKAGDQVVFLDPDGAPGYSSVVRLDVEAGEVELSWSEEQEGWPCVVLRNEWVSPRSKPAHLVRAGRTGPGPRAG